MKSKNLLCIQPTLGKQVRFFERKLDFLESENQGSLNENQKYMELKTRGSLSKNLIWWNYLPKNYMCKKNLNLEVFNFRV